MTKHKYAGPQVETALCNGSEQSCAGIGNDRSILVVEDNLVTQRLMTAMLTTLGWRIDVANNGYEARVAVNSRSYLAILMDCEMPVINGFDASRGIRQVEPLQLRTPIVAVTATDEAKDIELCYASGMDYVLIKPVSIYDLDDVLKIWLGADLTNSPQKKLTPTSIHSAVDSEVIKDLLALGGNLDEGKQLVNELIDIYLDRIPVILDEIERALVCRASKSLVYQVHQLKGASRNLGLASLAKVCDQIEFIGLLNHFESAQLQLRLLRLSAGRAMEELENVYRKVPV